MKQRYSSILSSIFGGKKQSAATNIEDLVSSNVARAPIIQPRPPKESFEELLAKYRINQDQLKKFDKEEDEETYALIQARMSQLRKRMNEQVKDETDERDDDTDN